MATLLVTVDALKGKMLIADDLQGMDPSLEGAIRAAQLRIASFFDSSLEKMAHDDTFYLDSDSFSGIQPNGLMKTMLSNALLATDPAVEIFVGPSWDDVFEPAPMNKVKIDYTRGIVSFDAETFKDKYVRVVYTAGYDYAGDVPDWLSEAILAYAPLAYFMGQVTNRNKEAEPGYKLGAEHALALLAPFTRNTGMCFQPL